MIGMGWRDSKFGDRLYLDEDGKKVSVAIPDNFPTADKTSQIPIEKK